MPGASAGSQPLRDYRLQLIDRHGHVPVAVRRYDGVHPVFVLQEGALHVHHHACRWKDRARQATEVDREREGQPQTEMHS